MRYGQSSQTDASKAGLASTDARSVGLTEKASWCQSTRLSRLRCETSTPFGSPVEPDV